MGKTKSKDAVEDTGWTIQRMHEQLRGLASTAKQLSDAVDAYASRLSEYEKRTEQASTLMKNLPGSDGTELESRVSAANKIVQLPEDYLAQTQQAIENIRKRFESCKNELDAILGDKENEATTKYGVMQPPYLPRGAKF